MSTKLRDFEVKVRKAGGSHFDCKFFYHFTKNYFLIVKYNYSAITLHIPALLSQSEMSTKDSLTKLFTIIGSRG